MTDKGPHDASTLGEPVQTGRTAPAQIAHYRIESLIGSGGAGRVYRAYDTALNRYVALKLLNSENPDIASRFLMEAKTQARVEQEHVCKVYEAGEENGITYIAMQLISGSTLGVAAKEMTLSEKLRVMQQVSEAVHAANKQGLIHRDIKPSNIMVEQGQKGEWKPYVMDFGLARQQGAPGLTVSGVVVGTPHYMSPEQAQGKTQTLDIRTDVYGIGATLYDILSGHPPFQGESVPEVLIKVLQEDVAPLRDWGSQVPADLETVVMKCLEKEPERRYSTAWDVAEELRRYLDGEPIQARPASWSYRWSKKARKNRFAVAGLGSALLVTLALTASLIWVGSRGRLQAHYATEFGEELRHVESMIRSVLMAPLHDVRSFTRLQRSTLNTRTPTPTLPLPIIMKPNTSCKTTWTRRRRFRQANGNCSKRFPSVRVSTETTSSWGF